MLTQRQLFLQHVAQTSFEPMMLEIESAKGIYLFSQDGKKYADLISGISVSNTGHRHPKVIDAIEAQLKKYLHLMVYGEYIQSPQVLFAKLLAEHLPENLNTVYFTNSGTEATEGAMKLAKRLTERTEFISFHHSYHGHTQGALSIMGDEYWKQSFRPLIPGNRLLKFNDFSSVNQITEKTAAVIVEPVQAEAGVMLPDKDFLKTIRKRCNETGTLMILDEIQTGMGRTGSFFCFEQHDFIPDILLLAKALGGGLPLGAFISSQRNMQMLSHAPVLGHITTFGGNPVCTAAGMASMKVILEEDLIAGINHKTKMFTDLLHHQSIKDFRHAGLLMAVDFGDEDFCKSVMRECLANGVITDWFLFASHCMRIAPPLTITDEEINEVCPIILQAIEKVSQVN